MRTSIIHLLAVFISSTFLVDVVDSFQSASRRIRARAYDYDSSSSFHRMKSTNSNINNNINSIDDNGAQEESQHLETTRRKLMKNVITNSMVFTTIISPLTLLSDKSNAAGPAEPINYSPDFVQTYSDFVKADEGWQYKDVKVGSGDSPQLGDRVVYDWSGYTIGYFGRPFEAKGGPQGGAFDKDLDYSRTILGSKKVVSALESNFLTMKAGGIRQVVVPYGPLSYPDSDMKHDVVGPKPSTFSGQRALNFVLENPRVDRTLLFNVKLARVDKSDGNGGFIRGAK